MEFNLETIKKLREETGAGVMDVKNALEQSEGDLDLAKKILHEKGLSRAAKRQDRETSEGIIYPYIHQGSKIGTLVMLTCETDFVAKTDDFSYLAREIAMQIAGEEVETVDELLKVAYMRDTSKTLGDLVAQLSAKTGEKIELKKFVKFAI
jgi:elongation factor Ts